MTEQTRGQMEAVYRLFRDHVDDAPLATVQRPAVATFFDRIKRLPANWGRQGGVKEMSLARLLSKSKPDLSALLCPLPELHQR